VVGLRVGPQSREVLRSQFVTSRLGGGLFWDDGKVTGLHPIEMGATPSELCRLVLARGPGVVAAATTPGWMSLIPSGLSRLTFGNALSLIVSHRRIISMFGTRGLSRF
jgi:hypothetical protein